MARAETILVFDSGLGGLTVHCEVIAARPHANFIYVADDAAFPYGALTEVTLVARVTGLFAELIDTHRPDIIVIAVGFVMSFIAGWFVVKRFLDYVSGHGFSLFAWWRLIVGGLGLIGLLIWR